jgi:hypothetical protein
MEVNEARGVLVLCAVFLCACEGAEGSGQKGSSRNDAGQPRPLTVVAPDASREPATLEPEVQDAAGTEAVAADEAPTDAVVADAAPDPLTESPVAGEPQVDAGSSLPSGELVPHFKAGTRLKPWVIALEPGVEVLAPLSPQWFDAELSLPCFYDTAEDGQLRCLPARTSVVFADSECTEGVATWSTDALCGEAPPEFVSAPVPGSQCGGVRAFRVVQDVAPPGALYQLTEAGCEPQEFVGDGISFFQLEPVPPLTFVAVELVHQPRFDELGAFVVEGEDGSYSPYALYDPKRGSSCSRARVLEPLDRCIPPGVMISQFTDSACSQGAAWMEPPDACSPAASAPEVLTRTEVDVEATCGVLGTVSLFEVGELVDSGASYQLQGDQCVEVAGGEGSQLLVAAGTPIDPQVLPLVETVELGTGNVRGVFDGLHGQPIVSFGMLDASRGARCMATLFSDGAHYCVPLTFEVATSGSIYFEDEGCVGSRVYPWSNLDACRPASFLPEAVLFGRGGACVEYAIDETLPVVGELSVERVYALDPESGACAPMEASSEHVLLLGETQSPAEVFTKLEIALGQ